VEHDFELEPAPAAPRPAVRPEALQAAPAVPASALPLPTAAGNAAVTRLVRQVRRTELDSQGAGPLDPEIGAEIEAARGGGSPLADPVRSEMEHHFGLDLGAVRLHTGSTAATLSRSVQAEAFTTGTDIFLGGGSPDAASSAGRELLAHELTHVVQQSTGAGGEAATVSHPHDPAEVQARAVGRAVADAGLAAQPVAGGGPDEVSGSAGGVAEPAAVSRSVPADAPAVRPAGGLRVIARAPAGDAAAAAGHAQQTADAAQQAAGHAQQTADQASTAAAGAQQTGDAAKKAADDAIAAANKAMDAAKLNELRGVARFHINLAFTEYVSACRDIRDSIKAAAKQNAEMMALILDITMGFAAPGLARSLAGWANRLPVGATTLEYRVALAALDTEKVKTMFVSVTKTAGLALKSNSMALAGETETDAFLNDLETRTHIAFQAIGDDLGNQDAAHVGVVAATFDASVANKNAYRAEIKQLTDAFERQVAPIGEAVMFTENMPDEVVWVKDGGARKLALVEYKPGLLGLWGNRYWLHQWISPQMQALALAKQQSRYGRVETIDKDELSMAH
jgi:Domain of unknown function (DUF4157)